VGKIGLTISSKNGSRAWPAHAYVLLGLTLALAVWVQRQPLLDVLGVALRDEEQSHIFLVPLVAGWLLWMRRSRLRYVRLRPSLVGPAAVLLGGIVSWWGFDSGTDIAWHAGAGLTVLGVLFSFTGLEPLRQFAPVFFVLLFALPVPGVIRQAIAIPLQTMATAMTQAVLELFAVNVFRSGNVLIINGEQIAVGEACNGMRMVFAFTIVVYAFAFTTPLKFTTRFVLVAMSPITALLCNVIRLVPTSLFFGYGTASEADWFHDTAGWIMLPIALIIHIHAVRLMKWLEFPVAQLRLASQ
jgi:exosortase